jgi:hypothetical protein
LSGKHFGVAAAAQVRVVVPIILLVGTPVQLEGSIRIWLDVLCWRDLFPRLPSFLYSAHDFLLAPKISKD